MPSVSKGSVSTVSLSKNELFNLFSDDYFSIQSNVKTARVVYVSSSGNQKEILTFDLSEETPQTEIEVSVHARDGFLLNFIILEDFDGGTLTIMRSQLSSSALSEVGAISFLTAPASAATFNFLPEVVASLSSSQSISSIVLVTNDGNPPTTGPDAVTMNLVYEECYIELQNGARFFGSYSNGSASPADGTQMSIVPYQGNQNARQLHSSPNGFFNLDIMFQNPATFVNMLIMLRHSAITLRDYSVAQGFVDSTYVSSSQPYVFANLVTA
jgi:hypothetical protein